MSDFKKLTESVAFKNFEKCNKITAKLEYIRKISLSKKENIFFVGITNTLLKKKCFFKKKNNWLKTIKKFQQNLIKLNNL